MAFLLLMSFVIAAAGSNILQPNQLQADGSNTLSDHLGSRFAIGGEAPAPTFTWAPRHGHNNEVQTAYEIIIKQSHAQHGVRPALDALHWGSGRIVASTPRAVYSGPALKGKTYYTWMVRFWDSKNVSSPWSAPAEFHFAPPSVSSPKWISSVKAADGSEPINLFRTTFDVKSAPARATLYICGLGYSYPSVNGKAAGSQLLTTAPWTNNERRSGYSSIDVTSLLITGTNAVGVALGHGWRDTSSFKRLDPENGKGDLVDKTFWAELHVVNTDGTETIYADTATAKWTGGIGPSTYDSVYNGETYNASMEQPGWDTAAFAPSSVPWVARAISADPPAGRLTPWSAPPVMLDVVVKPVAITQPSPGVFVVDFGVNQAGVCKLSNIKLPKGASVTLVHAEILQHALLPGVPSPDPKMIYTANLRSAKATDTYIARGDAAGESYYPRFTYHGFRYVQVTGLKTLDTADIEMHHFHSSNVQTTIATYKSNVLTKLMAMGVGSQRSNQMTVQTDCDQRDERLGWMGDANLSGDSLALNFKISSFLTSFAEVMNDELNADGSSVDVAPNVRYGGRPGDISWTPAFIALPYAIFKVGGDTSVAAKYLDGMLLHLGNIAAQCKNSAGISCPTKYGDWVPPNSPGDGQGPKPSKPYTSSFSYIDTLQKIGEMAAALGNKTVAASLAAEHTRLAASFNEAFFHASTNTYDNGVMTTYTLPLHLDIVPAANLAAVRKNLLDQVATTNKGHNECGIIGMKFLFEQLAAMGREDEALAVLEGTDYPSLGFMGFNTYEPATENLWELWDAYHEGTGMNSRNHHMFSSFTKYLVEHPGGVSQAPGTSGFTNIELRPAHTRGLSGASVTSTLDHGLLNFTWARTGGIQCSKAPASTDAQLSCGAGGGKIQTVRFASFGRPIGSCSTFGVDALAGCHVDVRSIVSDLCVGKQECVVPASTDVLGPLPQACFDLQADGAPHRLHVEVECEHPTAVEAEVRLPISSTGRMILPAAGISAPVLRSSSSPSPSGAQQQHVVLDASGREVVVAALGSGTHTLRLEPSGGTAAVVVTAHAVGSRVQAACPPNHHVNHVRFASFGNPTLLEKRVAASEYDYWMQGSCHLGSAIATVEEACLGERACAPTITNVGRITTEPQCSGLTAPKMFAVQLECVADHSDVNVTAERR